MTRPLLPISTDFDLSDAPESPEEALAPLVEDDEDEVVSVAYLTDYTAKGAPTCMLAPHELDKVKDEIHYPAAPPGAWVISGPLGPWGSMARTSSQREFATLEEARAWADSRFVVYEDESRPDLGFWAYRVRAK
jgi:hypothetical protein